MLRPGKSFRAKTGAAGKCLHFIIELGQCVAQKWNVCRKRIPDRCPHYAQSLPCRTVSSFSEPAGRGFSSLDSCLVRLIHADQSTGRSTTTWRLWKGAMSGPGEVVSIVNDAGWLP